MTEVKELVLKPGWLDKSIKAAQIYAEEHAKADKRAARRIKAEVKE